jgi:hypothetical protein
MTPIVLSFDGSEPESWFLICGMLFHLASVSPNFAVERIDDELHAARRRGSDALVWIDGACVPHSICHVGCEHGGVEAPWNGGTTS